MSGTEVQGYDPDEDLLGIINRRDKWFVNRLHEVFAGEQLDKTAPMVRILLVDRYEDEVRQFAEDYEIFDDRNINRRYAEEFLESQYDVPRENLDTDNRWELLLVIYEHGLEDELETILFRAELFAVKNERPYYLDEPMEIEGLEEKVEEFMGVMNKEEQRLDPLHVRADESEEGVFLQIYSEYGRKYRRTFEFRKQGEEIPPAQPSITGEQYYPLKNIGMGIEPGENRTKIIFTKDPEGKGWKKGVNELFKRVFDVPDLFDRIEKETSTVVESIQEGAKEAAESEDDTSDVLRDVIEETKDEQKEALEDEDLPEEREEELTTKFESIELVGYAINDDQSTSTDEFVIIANNLDNLFETIDGIETSFQDYLEKADEQNIELILQVGGERVQLTAGDWRPLSGRISEENKEALERFFSESDEQ